MAMVTFRSLVLFALCTLGAGLALGQDVDLQPVPATQAQALLKALIPSNKKFVSIDAYVAGKDIKDVNLGTSCSSSSSGSTSGTVDDSGNITAQTRTDGSSSCRELHKYYKTLYLGFRDSADPQYSYLVTTQCVEKWRWDHCEMPPEKAVYPITIEREKHGGFTVYVGTQQKLGGKVKVAKFAVLDITHVKMNSNNQAAAKVDDK
jgi:hypothetical protein